MKSREAARATFAFGSSEYRKHRKKQIMANHIHINNNYQKKMKILFGKNKFQSESIQIKQLLKLELIWN